MAKIKPMNESQWEFLIKHILFMKIFDIKLTVCYKNKQKRVCAELKF